MVQTSLKLSVDEVAKKPFECPKCGSIHLRRSKSGERFSCFSCGAKYERGVYE